MLSAIYILRKQQRHSLNTKRYKTLPSYSLSTCGCEYFFHVVVIFVAERLMSRSVPYNGKLTSHRMRINGLKKKKKRLAEVFVVYKKEMVGGGD